MSLLRKGMGFLQSFKAVSDGLSNERKIQVFSGFLECEVLEWLLGSKFNTWLELEYNFLQTWCVVIRSTNAIFEAAKFYHEEHTHICVHTLRFEETWRIFSFPSQRRL